MKRLAGTEGLSIERPLAAGLAAAKAVIGCYDAAGNLLGSGSGDILQGIRDAQLFPFEGAQGVIG